MRGGNDLACEIGGQVRAGRKERLDPAGKREL